MYVYYMESLPDRNIKMKYLSSEAVSLDVPITILDCERALASADCRQSAPKSTNPDKYECVADWEFEIPLLVLPFKFVIILSLVYQQGVCLISFRVAVIGQKLGPSNRQPTMVISIQFHFSV